MCILVTQYTGHVEFRKALWSVRLQWEPQSLQPSWSCTRLPQSLADHTDLTTSSLPSLTSDSKARREETSYKQSSLSPFQGRISFFANTSYVSDSLWKTTRQGISWTPSGWFFFLAVQCLRIGTEPSERNKSSLDGFVVPIILLIV